MDDIWNSWHDEKKMTNNGMVQNILHYANKLQKDSSKPKRSGLIKSFQQKKTKASNVRQIWIRETKWQCAHRQNAGDEKRECG